MKIPKFIKHLFSVYLSSIFMFFIFRLILFVLNFKEIGSIKNSLASFFIGWRFDTVITSYILIIPLLLYIILFFIGKTKIATKSINIYFSLIFSLILLANFADIPFFSFFFTRLNSFVFEGAFDVNYAINFILQNLKYLLLIIGFFITIFFVPIFLKKLRTNIYKTDEEIIYKSISKIFYTVTLLILMFGGLRGTFFPNHTPLVIGDSYFCENSFLNLLSQNPVFTLGRSILNESKKLQLMDNETAIKNVQQYLKINKTDKSSPIARNENITDSCSNTNLVLILMESMTIKNLSHNGNKKNITPFLDSLIDKSIFFSNFYSSGIHTHNGIATSLFSMPTCYREHSFKTVGITKYNGISNTLKKYDYTNICFINHNENYDNVGSYLRENDFNEIYSQKNYPKDEVISIYGVADHSMFNYSIKKLNELDSKNKSFFATFITTSNHVPYTIPKNCGFTGNQKEEKYRIIEYADWALSKFMKDAKKQKWFNNTVFIFVADHGVNRNSIYDMSLSYQHIPLIIYSPKLIQKSRIISNFGIQSDIFPTAMDLLNINYTNKTLGVNLLNKKREFSYFSADDKIGCIDEQFFFIHRDNGTESLYKYKTKDKKNYIETNKEIANAMRKYAFSMLQTSSYLKSKMVK